MHLDMKTTIFNSALKIFAVFQRFFDLKFCQSLNAVEIFRAYFLITIFCLHFTHFQFPFQHCVSI